MSNDFDPGEDWEEVPIDDNVDRSRRRLVLFDKVNFIPRRYWLEKPKEKIPTEEYTLIRAVVRNPYIQPQILYLKQEQWINGRYQFPQHGFDRYIESFTILAKPVSTTQLTKE